MQPLEKLLRNKLEKTVKDARDIAEDAARAALKQLGVGEPTAYPHLTEADRVLRRKLRAHGRQLGNGRNAKGEQALDRLIEEVAYEHWHRMLFARFLAENNLLMYPDPDDPVAVTLEECEDLAPDEGASNGWELASRYAARMLPQIFRPDSPVFKLVLPPEHQQKLEGLVTEFPQQVFTASDSLGWVYQFWQAKKKDEINASEVKIGARELPAVTQLFTEPYMVSFLLDNSLGAWWAARRLSEADLKNATSEEELRRKAAIPGVPLEYLRFVKIPLNPPFSKGELDADHDQLPPLQKGGGGGFIWTPAAGTFDGWPQKLSELKTLDPCCGSGHFLVSAFLMLVPMRMELEGLTAREAVDAVLRQNIHGLELDQRCVEIAAFALAITAWRYPDLPSPEGRGAGGEGVKPIGYRPLPKLNLACTGFSVGGSRTEWERLANGNSKLRVALFGLYEEFKNAPILGSLIDPTRGRVAKLIDWNDLATALTKALEKERTDEQHEAGVAAHGLAEAARLLAGKYHWVITNVPYLARGKQDERLRDFCKKHYPTAKNDLATVFLDRCLELCSEGGTSSIVLPQNWLFLTSYRKFREKLLKDNTWHLIARLGPQAFQTPMWDFNVQLITTSRGNAASNLGGLFGEAGPDGNIRGLDVSEPRTAAEKAAELLTAKIKSVEQAKQLENPDVVISFEEINSETFLGKYVRSLAGTDSGDSQRFMFKYWELDDLFPEWIYQLNSVNKTKDYGGRENILLFENGHGALSECPGSSIRNVRFWGKLGVTVSTMRNNPASLSLGESWCRNCACLVPEKVENLGALWSYCSSGQFHTEVRKINQKLRVAEAVFEIVPFDLNHWTKVAEEK